MVRQAKYNLLFKRCPDRLARLVSTDETRSTMNILPATADANSDFEAIKAAPAPVDAAAVATPGPLARLARCFWGHTEKQAMADLRSFDGLL